MYGLTNTATGERVFVKAFANDPDPELPSVVALWKGADWMEREVYDMYGVRFDGHPDLRRILMPDEFTALPAAEGLPAPRPRRAAQLPDRHAGRELKTDEPQMTQMTTDEDMRTSLY